MAIANTDTSISVTSGRIMARLRKKTYQREIAAGLNARANLAIWAILRDAAPLGGWGREGWQQARARQSALCHSSGPANANEDQPTERHARYHRLLVLACLALGLPWPSGLP